MFCKGDFSVLPVGSHGSASDGLRVVGGHGELELDPENRICRVICHGSHHSNPMKNRCTWPSKPCIIVMNQQGACVGYSSRHTGRTTPTRSAGGSAGLVHIGARGGGAEACRSPQAADPEIGHGRCWED